MTPEERIKTWKLHPSMRGAFAFELYKAMAKDDRIFLLVGDLGYGAFDAHKEDFGNRFINTGAAEQAMLDIAVGLAQDGKIPFVYSITPFLIYRPFETLRTYINHENVPVKLIGAGRDDDYKHDGFSHNASDVGSFLDQLPNIHQYWPKENNKMASVVDILVKNEAPSFISLKR